MSQAIIEQLTKRNQELEGKIDVANELAKNLDSSLSRFESLDIDGLTAQLESYVQLGSIERITRKMNKLAKYESIDTPEEVENLIKKATEILQSIDDEFGTPEVIRDKFEELNSTINDLQTKATAATASAEKASASLEEVAEVASKAESIITVMAKCWGTQDKMVAKYESLVRDEHLANVTTLSKETGITAAQAEMALGKFESYDEAKAFITGFVPSGKSTIRNPKHESNVPLERVTDNDRDKAEKGRSLRDLTRRM